MSNEWRVRVWTPTGWATWWDGSAMVDYSTIDVLWDGLVSGGPDQICVEDIATVLYVRPGVFREGMFFSILDSDVCSRELTPPDRWHGMDTSGDGDGSNDASDTSVVFARLTN